MQILGREQVCFLKAKGIVCVGKSGDCTNCGRLHYSNNLSRKRRKKNQITTCAPPREKAIGKEEGKVFFFLEKARKPNYFVEGNGTRGLGG